MRILLVSYFFPPYNTVGAVRAAKFAKYFERFGHEVWVLTARDQPYSTGLALESDPSRVHAVPWWNVNAPVEFALGGRQRIASSGFQPSASRPAYRRVAQLYKTFLHLPDAQIGWIPYAVKEGKRMLRQQKFDMIYASAPPFSGLIVAQRLAKTARVRWFAELRDLWAQNNDYSFPRWRRILEMKVEQRTLGGATGIVTVSEPLAQRLRESHARPIATIANGFDPEDYDVPLDLDRRSRRRLNLLYTGMLYGEQYEIDALCAALAKLSASGLRESVHLNFYGRYLGVVVSAARRHGVVDMISVHAPIAYRDAIMLQREADVLLFFPWGRPADRGVMSTKVYEYLGARRPVLAIGNPDADSSQLLIARTAGFASKDPHAIAERIGEWLRQKLSDGEISDLPPSSAAGLTREERMRDLESFLLGFSTERSLHLGQSS